LIFGTVIVKIKRGAFFETQCISTFVTEMKHRLKKKVPWMFHVYYVQKVTVNIPALMRIRHKD